MPRNHVFKLIEIISLLAVRRPDPGRRGRLFIDALFGKHAPLVEPPCDALETTCAAHVDLEDQHLVVSY